MAKNENTAKNKESLIPVALWVATVIFAAVFASGGGDHGKTAMRNFQKQTVIGANN